MEKKYRKIEFLAGDTISSAVANLQQFKERGELVCASFNGVMLYSDIDDIDSAYIKITGKTKAESDEDDRKWHEDYEEKKRKHKEAIPELTKEWIEKGNQILDEEYRELWAKCVPVRLGDLYEGMELGMCLDIVLQLNAGCKFEVAKDIIESQGHSGMSWGLICSMLKSFCKRGNEFVRYLG